MNEKTGDRLNDMIFAAGVDVGSTQAKACILDGKKEIVALALCQTGAHVERAAREVFSRALAEAKLGEKEVSYVVGTGYGRFKVTFGDDQITEISCHAKGAHFMSPKTRTVIDMGGQDTKVIKVGENGEVIDFAMNDKCAAGTGRFLQAAAEVMKLSLDEIGEASLRAERPIKMTTVCTVFVEQDIIAYLAQNCRPADILAGVHKSIAARTVSLARRTGIEPEVAFSGGVARNIGMVRALEEALQCGVNVSNESHFIGAIGAAVFALERAFKKLPAKGGNVDLKEWVNPNE